MPRRVPAGKVCAYGNCTRPATGVMLRPCGHPVSRYVCGNCGTGLVVRYLEKGSRWEFLGLPWSHQ